MSTEKMLRAMFESDRDARDYFAKFPPYEIDAAIGFKPWWPPASEVWRYQGVPPDWEKSGAWAEAWAALQALHEKYLAARRTLLCQVGVTAGRIGLQVMTVPADSRDGTTGAMPLLNITRRV